MARVERTKYFLPFTDHFLLPIIKGDILLILVI